MRGAFRAAWLGALRLTGWTLVAAACCSARAHIGSPNVFFDGQAGPYPIHVVIQPPGVIPGLAEISVRVQTNGVDRVTVLPIRWNAGRQGAPKPDEAKSVSGETNLFHGQLWFMREGAQSVEIGVSGGAGAGSVIVPVNAIATRVLSMPGNLGKVLAGLGLLLFVLLVRIVGGAVRESVLPIGQTPSEQRVWSSRVMMLVAAVALSAFLWFGKVWWAHEASDYRNNRLYRPLQTTATLQDDGKVLRIELTDEKFHNTAPLVPEHGKLMHLFLVREPGLDCFAHLHPSKRSWKRFEAALPDLSAGEYRLYADITYETGLSDTLTATLSIPERSSRDEHTGSRSLDPDDAWIQSRPVPEQRENRVPFPSEYSMEWLSAREPLVEGRDVRLRFVVRDRQNHAKPVDPYMGMRGHLILRRTDGAVFTHLHPSGSFSMAAQQLFELRVAGKAPLKTGAVEQDPLCQLAPLTESQARWLEVNAADDYALSFPYAFPRAGAYRLWVQVRVEGKVLTGVFDTQVSDRTRPVARFP